MYLLFARRQAAILCCSILFICACNGDIGDQNGGGATPDAGGDRDAAGDPDAGYEVDAAPPVTRSGTVAITDTRITNFDGVGGALVSIRFVDDQTVTVPALPGFDTDPPIGTCHITVYDDAAGDRGPTLVDEGPVTVTGTGSDDFICSFAPPTGDYVCQSARPPIRGGTAGNAAMGTLNVGGEFLVVGAGATPEMQGMEIELAGFMDGQGDPVGGAFPIVAVGGPDRLTLANVPASCVATADATYTTFVGRKPIPNPAGFDFLAGQREVLVHKDGTTLVPAFDVMLSASGEDFALAGTQPHQFPTAAADLTFTCEGASGNCGAEGSGGEVGIMLVEGETTDVLPEGDDDGTRMEPPTTRHATFRCASLVNSVSIPMAGVEAILGTNPARIQVSVSRLRFDPVPGAPGTTTTVMVGHSLIGFTTVAPAPALR